MTGKELRNLRRGLKLTIQRVADDTGYSHSSIWRAEHSKEVSPRIQKLVELFYKKKGQ